MRNGYVGIASRFGLESLWAEQAHTSTFLLRQLARHRDSRAVCFWAVIDRDFAEQIIWELANGDRHDALLLLQTLAQEIGRILPMSDHHTVAAHR